MNSQTHESLKYFYDIAHMLKPSANRRSSAHASDATSDEQRTCVSVRLNASQAEVQHLIIKDDPDYAE